MILRDVEEQEKPHNYQWAAFKFALLKKKCALFMEMGLGKTWPAAAVCAYSVYNFETDKCIVFGPKRVIEEAWPEELAKRAYTKNLTYEILNGTEKQIHRKLDKPGVDIHLCSYDRAHIILKKARFPKYGTAVLDESQGVRNKSTRRWEAVNLLTSRCERIIALTGTPSPNGLHQLWAQLHLLDGGRRLGKTFGAFMKKWFSTNAISGKIEANKGTEEQINARIKGICFTLLAEDYQNLPPLIVNDIEVRLSDEEMERYEKFEEEAVLSIPGLQDDIRAVNVAALYQKLTQFSNGAVYDTEKKYHVVHDKKLEALDSIIEEAFGENVLIIYQHRSDLDRILKKYPGRAVWLKSIESITDWKAGKIEIGVGHPESIGRGLNLQSGGRIIVWYGLTWNLEAYLQTIKRLWRQGQSKPVIMHRLICKGTIDNTIVNSIKRKDKSQRGLMLAMKRDVIDKIFTRKAT